MKTNTIDGFVLMPGHQYKVITFSAGIYTIGAMRYTYLEAINLFANTYSDTVLPTYVNKLQDCRDMKWLTDDLHQQLKDHRDWVVRSAVAQYSDKYHEELKDDPHEYVRAIIARYSDTYHAQLKHDNNPRVHKAINQYYCTADRVTVPRHISHTDALLAWFRDIGLGKNTRNNKTAIHW